MNHTVITAVNQASKELGITQFELSQAIGSADQDTSQMVALLSAVADEVLQEQPYEDTIGDGYWLLAADGTTFRNVPTADTDKILFDGRLCVNGLKFRFLKAKGLEFGEELRDFSARLNKLAARANARVLDLDADWGVVQ